MNTRRTDENVRDPEPLAQGTTSHLCLETATSVQPAVPSGPCPGSVTPFSGSSESSPVIPSGSSQAGSDPSHLVYGTPIDVSRILSTCSPSFLGS